MQLKRYEAKSINEAMGKIKRDLGDSAVVLSTKRVKTKKGQIIEVVAARDEDLINESKRQETNDERNISDIHSTIISDVSELKYCMKNFMRSADVGAELAEIKENLNTFFDFLGIQKGKKESSGLSKVYYYLLTKGISRKQALGLIEKLQDNYEPQKLQNYDDALKHLEVVLRQSIALSYGKQTKKKKIFAFVGPTGAGKTTTLAKLAAHHLFDRKSKIGIITMDTYRIGATDQLKKYADIMNVPMKVATEKRELEKVLANFSDREVVLVDTPGRSRMDGEYLLKLKDCISTIPSLETNLVMSVTSNDKIMIDTANRFGITGYDNIIFTKLDDSDCFGYIYNVINTISKPVSYITDGQNVPRDIQAVDPGILARIIMKNRIRDNAVSVSH